MRMSPHLMHGRSGDGTGKINRPVLSTAPFINSSGWMLNARDEKEGQSYREQCGLRGSIQCGLRVGASTNEQAERPATE